MSSVEPVCIAGGPASVPAVTVLIPAYNAGPLLREAVDSILVQTFTDFECLVIDDGSTDGSIQALVSIDDPRLRVVRNPKNLGLIATLNRGIELARAPLLARMDADDLSMPTRLERQVAALESSPGLAVVGSWARVIGLDGSDAGALRPPVEPRNVLAAVLRDCPFIHPSVMIRTPVLRELGGYRADAQHAEDLGLWLTLLLRHDGANLPEFLICYRVHPGQVSQTKLAVQRATAMRLQRAARPVYAKAQRLPSVDQPDEPGQWAQLRGAPGTLGADCKHWSLRYWKLGASRRASAMALRGLLHAPFCLDLYRLITPPQMSPRYWWRVWRATPRDFTP